MLGQSAQGVDGQVSANDAWLQKSWEVTRGPGSFAGELVSTPSTTCETRTVEDVRETASTYTCETGRAVGEAACTSTYVPVFDTDYVYACETGTVWSDTPASCTKRRIVVIDEDYVYGCQTSWSGGVHTRSTGCAAIGVSGCQAGAATCTQPSNLPPQYVCEEGYSGTTGSAACGETLNVSTSIYWRYDWNTRRQEIEADMPPPMGMSQCFEVRAYQSGTTWRIVYDCPSPLASLPRDVVYVSQAGLVTGESWSPTGRSCTAASDAACTYQGTVCTEGARTRIINGVSIYRECWAREMRYGCGTRTNYPGCSPPAGLQLLQSRCLASSGSDCTGWERVYSDPSGGCAQSSQDIRCETSVLQVGAPIDTPRDVVSDTWSNDCDALAGDGACSRIGSTITEGAATRIIDGLSVTRDSWAVREDHVCSASSAVDSCSPFSACMLETSLCASTDRHGVCTAWNRRYRCEENTGNDPPPVATPTEQVGGASQDNACPQRSDPSCRVSTNDACTRAGGTRTVNGNQATASCWEQTDTFQCQSPSQTSNCLPPAGCTLQRQECVNEGQAPGACTAVENVYACRTTISTPREETRCTTTVCVGQECYDKPAGGAEEKARHDLPDALAALYVANEAGKDYSADVSIFKGQPLRCRKAVLGFLNCCKDSGWGVDMGLAQCDDQERTLMQRQQAQAVHYVGTYCDRDSLFGCVVKGMRYCRARHSSNLQLARRSCRRAA